MVIDGGGLIDVYPQRTSEHKAVKDLL